MDETELEKRAEDLLALLRGEPGPFLESESSFFGKKRVDPSMKEHPMETDCGGAVITKSKMTYGEADELARTADLTDFLSFLAGVKPSCYWKPREEDGSVYIGDVWWSVYSYLVTKGYLRLMTPAYYGNGHPQKRGPESYDNSLEYLYNEVLKRLQAASVFHTSDGLWFTFGSPPEASGTSR